MSLDPIKGSKKAALGKLATGSPAAEKEPVLKPIADADGVMHRPSNPQELLQKMVERAKAAEAEAAKAAGEVAATVAQDPGKAVTDAATEAGKIVQQAAGEAGKIARRVGDEAGKIGPLSATPAAKSFLGGLWDKVKSVASDAWKGIKAFSDKTGISKVLSWVGDKLGKGFTFLQQGLQWLVYGVSFREFKTRTVDVDPDDVNHVDWNALKKAEADTKTNLPAEEAALAKLPADQQEQYKRVRDLTAKDKFGRFNLQKMLLDGRLPGGPDLKGQGTILANLDKMATEKLAGKIDRNKLVSEVISEIENPVAIDQIGKGTCVATTAQILLVRKNPAEYARLIAGLATPEGKAQMIGGEFLERNADWQDSSDGDRTTSSRLIQPALMDKGEPGWGLLDYNNTEDKAYIGPIPLMGGLMGGGSAHINSQLQGREYDSHMFFHWNRGSTWDKVKEALSQGKGPIPCGVAWNDGDGVGGHQLQIDKVENGRVHYTNPWGQRESMSEEDFKGHITNAEIPK